MMNSASAKDAKILSTTLLWSSASIPRSDSSRNEDSLTVRSYDNQTLLIVADGLGGHNAGEIASRMVTRGLPTAYFEKQGIDLIDSMTEAVTGTNLAVYEAGLAEKKLQGMCSTVAACLVINQYAMFMHIGDSRGYLLRHGFCLHRTKDHSITKATQGLHAKVRRTKEVHVLTQALGARESVAPDLSIHRLEQGDIIVLCSDGLSDVLTDEEIAQKVFLYPPTSVADALLESALQKGSDDDVSVIVASVGQVAEGKSLNVRLSSLDKYYIEAT